MPHKPLQTYDRKMKRLVTASESKAVTADGISNNIIPNTTSIDLVIWFMGVEWVFFIVMVPIICTLSKARKERFIVPVADAIIGATLILLRKEQESLLPIYPYEKLFFFV